MAGVVFVNPPYGRGLARWVAKARGEFELGHARAVVALLPARPDTAYWHDHIAGRATVYFLRGRLRFGEGGDAARRSLGVGGLGGGPEGRCRPSTQLYSGPGVRGDSAGSGRFCCTLGRNTRFVRFQPTFMRPVLAEGPD